MDPSPKNNRGAPYPGPMKLEVPKRCRPTAIFTSLKAKKRQENYKEKRTSEQHGFQFQFQF